MAIFIKSVVYLLHFVETGLKYGIFHKSVYYDHIIWQPYCACPYKKQGSYPPMKETWREIWKLFWSVGYLSQFVETEPNQKIFYEFVLMII